MQTFDSYWSLIEGKNMQRTKKYSVGKMWRVCVCVCVCAWTQKYRVFFSFLDPLVLCWVCCHKLKHMLCSYADRLPTIASDPHSVCKDLKWDNNTLSWIHLSPITTGSSPSRDPHQQKPRSPCSQTPQGWIPLQGPTPSLRETLTDPALCECVHIWLSKGKEESIDQNTHTVMVGRMRLFLCGEIIMH